MKKTLPALIAFLAVTILFVSCGAKAPTEWTTDYNAALESAKKSGSNILLYVSGHDPDGIVEQLTSDVMTQKSFLKEAKGFIAVQLDYVNDPETSEEEISAVEEICYRLGVQYYPAVLCMTPDEKVFAEVMFAADYSTLESMTADLKNAVVAGKTFAKLQKQIEKATGVQKAEAMDALLQLVPQGYFNQYIDYARQIIDLDPENTSGITGTYRMLFTYNDAMTFVMMNNFDAAVTIFEDLASDPYLTPADKQQCYLFAASVWYHAQNWEDCFICLQKAIDADPDSENADNIADQLKMLQINYEMSLEMAQEGDIE